MLIPRTVVFVRHAESEGNQLVREAYERFPDDPDEALTHLTETAAAHPDRGNWNLTEHGEGQAARLRAFLFHRFGPNNFDTVFVSGLVRAQQTLAIALPNAPNRIDERLNEIPRGIFQSPNERIAQKARPREEILEHLTRRDDFIEHLLSGGYAGESIIVFGHGAWIASLLIYPNVEIALGHGSCMNPGLANTSLTTLRAYQAQPDVPEMPRWRLRINEYNIIPRKTA